MCEKEGVGRLQRVRQAGPARRVLGAVVAEEGATPGLVQGDPVADAIAQPARDDVHVGGEGLGCGARRPAPRVLERLREVPVIERDPGREAGGEERVDQALIEVEAGSIRAAPARRQYPRPGDREAVGAQAELAQEREVGGPAVVVVAGHVAGGAPSGLPGRVAEAVPDRLAAAVLPHRALDLIRDCGGSPNEPRRKAAAALRGTRIGGYSGRRHGFTIASSALRRGEDSPWRPIL